ncbi:MAG TPA: hypothetical protein VKB76_16090, partial [Ktedonobacterales bacterium]|nr:hypothetical protein [Ktedonobacterales bacterium]
MALFDTNGAIIRRAHRRSPAPFAPEELIAHYVALASELIQAKELRPSGAALALEGALDARTGMVVSLPSLPAWNDFPLGERLTSALDMLARIDTTTNAALAAEL